MKLRTLQATGLLIVLVATCGDTATAAQIADDATGTLKSLGLELDDDVGTPKVTKVSGIAEASGLKSGDKIVKVAGVAVTSAAAAARDALLAALKTQATSGNFKLTINPAANSDVDVLVMVPSAGQAALARASAHIGMVRQNGGLALLRCVC